MAVEWFSNHKNVWVDGVWVEYSTCRVCGALVNSDSRFVTMHRMWHERMGQDPL